MSGFHLLWAPLAAAFVAQTPTPPAADQRDIVVRGERIRHDQITGFIRALTNVPSAGQIGRFHSAVCPAVVGLPANQAQLIAERLRAVASAADIRVERGKCTPNVFLIAVPEKRAAIYALYKQFPAYFGSKTFRQVRHMAGDPAPVAAWQVKGRLSADGEMLEKPAGADYYVVERTGFGSRIRAGSVPSFLASIVVVELKTIGGLSVTQVADYAAMRAFADTDPARAKGSGAPTILTILDAADDEAVPLSLTHWDLGYLKSLYATSNAYYASYHRGAMAHALKKELVKSGEPGK